MTVRATFADSRLRLDLIASPDKLGDLVSAAARHGFESVHTGKDEDGWVLEVEIPNTWATQVVPALLDFVSLATNKQAGDLLRDYRFRTDRASA